MSEIDESVVLAMRERAEGDVGVEDLLAGARRQGMRRRGIRHTLIGTGVTAVVVAVGAVAMAQPTQQDRPPVAIQPVSAQVELVAALSNSENISFKIKATTTHKKGNSKDEAGFTYIAVGAMDPATATGYLTSDGETDIRLINGVRYERNGRQFLQYRGKFDRIDFDGHVMDGALSGSANSQQLFKVLRQADAEITKTGAASYHFIATTKSKEGTLKFVGDITLDGDKRVAKVAYDWHLDSPNGYFSDYKVTLEFSDYGAPVRVEKPSGEIVIVS